VVDNIAAIPSETDWKVIAETAQANSAIDRLHEQINALPKSTAISITENHIVTYSDSRNSANLPKKADGGAIYGPGGPRDDRIVALLSAGEHVLDAEDVKRMGGQAGVYSFRQALYQGVGRFADGGAIDSAPFYTRVASSSSGWEERLAAGMVDGRSLAPMSTHYSTTTVDNSKTVAQTVSLGSGNTFYSYDPTEIAKQQRREMQRALALAGPIFK
jgi:hypothetical protein